VPELDLAPAVRRAPDRAAGAASPDLVGLHVDVALGSATLSASWPQAIVMNPVPDFSLASA
jgi:hypothetical protein